VLLLRTAGCWRKAADVVSHASCSILQQHLGMGQAAECGSGQVVWQAGAARGDRLQTARLQM
jgi:hypothetical protein